MSVAVEILEGLKRQVTLKLDSENVKAEKNKRLQEIARRARLDGYRPGKVPMKVVERNFGDQAENDVVNELFKVSFSAAIKENNLKTAGAPEVRLAENQAYAFIATFEVMPEFALNDLTELSVIRTEAEVTDSDVDSMIITLQKQHTNWEKVTRSSQLEDRVIIDFEGSIDGSVFEGGNAKATTIILGSGSMIPGFEEALVGKKEKEPFSFEATFPETYHAEHLKGKKAMFSAELHSIEAPLLPAIDTDFVKKFGIESGDIELLKAELKKNMTRELNSGLKNKVKQQLIDALIEKNPIEVPQSMIEEAIFSLAEQSKFPKPENEAQAKEFIGFAKQIFGTDAEKRVRANLLISKFIEDEKIKLDSEYVEKQLDLTASTYEDAERVKAHFRTDKEAMSGIYNMALEDQVIDLLLSKAKVVTEKSSFDAVMKPK